MRNYICIITFLVFQINTYGENEKINPRISDFHSKLGGGCYSYGIELLNSKNQSEIFKKNLAMDLAALSFEYYFLHVIEAKIDRDIRMEFNVRELIKIENAKKSFSDPLGWFDSDASFSRGNLSKYKYKWHDDKNLEDYKKHIEGFNQYFAKDFQKIISENKVLVR